MSSFDLCSSGDVKDVKFVINEPPKKTGNEILQIEHAFYFTAFDIEKSLSNNLFFIQTNECYLI